MSVPLKSNIRRKMKRWSTTPVY